MDMVKEWAWDLPEVVDAWSRISSARSLNDGSGTAAGLGSHFMLGQMELGFCCIELVVWTGRRHRSADLHDEDLLRFMERHQRLMWRALCIVIW